VDGCGNTALNLGGKNTEAKGLHKNNYSTLAVENHCKEEWKRL